VATEAAEAVAAGQRRSLIIFLISIFKIDKIDNKNKNVRKLPVSSSYYIPRNIVIDGVYRI
jgi:hypothetical protein